jgi:phage terminase small subunit
MLTLKQEAFCQAYIENGGNASEAYRAAYDAKKMKPEVVNVKACELLKDGKVSVRVAELRAAIEKRHEITIDDLIEELEEARSQAVSLNVPQLSVAVSATMGKAKMLGFLTDKVDVKGSLTIDKLPDAVLEERMAELMTRMQRK